MSSMKAPVVVSVLACAASWTIALAAMSSAPAQMPIHWNLAGEPDGYTSGDTALLLIPVLQLNLALVMMALARSVTPAARRPTAWVGCAAVISLTWIELTFALRVWGYELPVDSTAAVAMAIPMLTVGFFMPNVPPNPIFGIRVSRTLGDERVWYAVHRRAARWVLAGGLGLLVAALVPMPFWVILVLFVFGPLLAALVIAYRVQPNE